MKAIATAIPGVLIIEPEVHGDTRGFFYESFNEKTFAEKTGQGKRFVQDNHSKSSRNVLRGLHYQVGRPQGKLVRVVAGEIYDVAVDLRKSSSRFLRWIGVTLSAENKRMLWIPEGFAHGFVVTSDAAEVLYKTTDYWVPGCERSIRWDDPSIDIRWPVDGRIVLSDKDRAAPLVEQQEVFA